MSCDELLKTALYALEGVALDCAMDSLNDAEQKYSATFRPERILTAKDDVDIIKETISEIKTYLKTKPEEIK